MILATPFGPLSGREEDRHLVVEVVEQDVYGFRAAPIRKGSLVVDVGAHIGIFSAWAASRGARVVAAEMDSDNWPLLDSDMAACPTVQAVHATVVGDEPPLGYVRVPDNAAGTFCVWDKRPDAIPAPRPFVTLAELVGEDRPIDFLKLDCEGSEYGILARAEREGVLQHVRRIGMEWHQPCQRGDRHVADLVRMLSGFDLSITDPGFYGGYLRGVRRP